MLKKVILFVIFLVLVSLPILSAERPRWVAQPIYVYVPQYGNYTALMKRAFMAWENKSNSLVRFKFVTKESNANIKVYFVDHVDNCGSELAVGCARMTTLSGQYYKGRIDIAMKMADKNNVYRPINNIYGVMLHEIGHALGLEHSMDPYSIMYPCDLPSLQYLTKEDLRLLYKKYH